MTKTTLISIAIFFAIGVILGAQLHGCSRGGARAPQALVQTRVRHDTTTVYTAPDTVWREVSEGLPKLTAVLPAQHHTTDNSVSPGELATAQAHTQQDSYPWPAYIDTLVYTDTIYRAELFRAAIRDTITASRIIGRSVWWSDLRPTEIRTVTNTVTVVKKEPLIKAYLGADMYGGQTGLDIAPAASLIISDRYMIDLGYYLLDRQLTAGFKVKLSFEK